MKERLIDQYSRKIDYLRISITDRCNLRCIYCMPERDIISKKEGKILTYEEILIIVKIAVSCGINRIRVTGGEPLIRKDIVHLIWALSKIKGIDDLSLTTNGILLDEYAEDLKKVGLKRINISLDTFDRERYKLITRFDGLNKVLEGIYKVLKIGFNPVKINVVVMRDINEDEIIEFSKLTIRYPLHIRFIEFMPVGPSVVDWEDRFISNDKIKDYCQDLGELEDVNGIFNNSISSSYRYRKAHGTISFISPISDPFCSNCSRLRLTSDGKLRLCLGSPQEVDLTSIVRSPKSSNSDLKNAFVFAAYSKPKGHNFNIESYISQEKTMCQIGG